jgi:suppressor of ftsI
VFPQRQRLALLALACGLGVSRPTTVAQPAKRASSAEVATGTPPCAPIRAADALPNSSLYCIELVPTPDLRQISGVVSLTPMVSPFGIAVTPDGHVRYALVAAIEGLPEPSTLGDFSAYVVWATTMSLDREIKLGVLASTKSSRTPLGELSLNQFRVFVSAEKSAAVTSRTGRMVLRATSPSARLLAHRDITQPSAASGMPASPSTGAAQSVGVTHDMGHAHSDAAASGGWVPPPMDPSMSMPPGMSALTPSVGPYRPGAGIELATIPAARPREILRLASGATLELEAGLVVRSIGAKRFVMFGFNGQYPGPLISVAQGATIVVRFTNHLDLPSAVHWHGVRLDNRYDGSPGVTQDPVPPGGTFTYRVHFRDAGLYWYHPHVREDIQQGLGLYGNILVRSPEKDYYGPANREEVVVLDDLSMTEEGPLPFGAEAPTHALMGRFGNLLLTNGEPEYRLAVQRGEVVRFFLTNVSNARVYNVSFGGARIKLIGSDVGEFEREQWVESVVLGPAERYIVEVRFAEAGDVAITNRIQALDHMAGLFRPEARSLGTVHVSSTEARPDYATAFATLRRHDAVIRDIDRYRRLFDKPVDRELHLTVRTKDLPQAVTSMFMGAAVPIDWNDSMPHSNWVATGREVNWVLREPSTGRENMDIAWRLHQGDAIKLRLFNDPDSIHPMDHPIHIHGQRFLVVRRNGVPIDNLVWKDTVIVSVGETVDLLLELSNPGTWMLHCHIAEHLGTGMMMVLQVDVDR